MARPGEYDRGDSTANIFNVIAGRFVLAPVRAGSSPLRNILDPRFFAVVSAEEAHTGADRVIRLRYRSADAKAPWEGTLEVLPDRCWAVRRHEFETIATTAGREPRPTKFLETMTVEYREGSAQPPIPKQVRFEGTQEKASFDFDVFRLDGDISRDEFTLASYGLPDVTAPVDDPARVSWSYWLIGLAVLALIGALWVRKRGP